jgi:hypothetical protein
MHSRGFYCCCDECEKHWSAKLAQRKIDEPLKPARPQETCDIGLFGDDRNQLDLVGYRAQALKRVGQGLAPLPRVTLARPRPGRTPGERR